MRNQELIMPDQRPLILASQSPRRKEFLRDWGIAFECDPSALCEPDRADGEPLGEYVERVALLKADEVAQRHQERLVLAADTIVTIGETILGKPVEEEEAIRFLRSLSGKWHQVWTGVVLLSPSSRWSYADNVVTGVLFRALTEEEIGDYVKTGEPLDKAGAYAIQGGAAGFVLEIDGPWDNVVGLPKESVLAGLGSFSQRNRT